jgi:hypothetical protein
MILETFFISIRISRHPHSESAIRSLILKESSQDLMLMSYISNCGHLLLFIILLAIS